MTKIVGIYRIQSPSGKIYIGQSWDVEYRLKAYQYASEDSYKNKRQPLLFNSFKKYGSDYHTFDIACQLPNDVEQSVLDLYEQFYIDQYKACGFQMLNLKQGGAYGKHSEETKKIIAECSRNRIVKDSTKKKLSEINKGNKNCVGKKNSLGMKHTDEWKQKAKQRTLGNKFSNGHKNFLGKTHSQETKQKLREINLGKKLSAEHKTKISEAFKDKPVQSVSQFDLNGNFLAVFKSAKEAASKCSISAGNLRSCLAGSRPNAGGFIWKYAEKMIPAY